MKLPLKVIANIFASSLIAISAAQAAAPGGTAADPRGRWITATGNLEVEVSACGAALCGTVTQVLGNRSMSRDGATMDPVDKRPALGMKILDGFVPERSDVPNAVAREWNGRIYNRENGKTYDCQMSVDTTANATGELVLHAYVGIPLFGKSQRWQRVPAK